MGVLSGEHALFVGLLGELFFLVLVLSLPNITTIEQKKKT